MVRVGAIAEKPAMLSYPYSLEARTVEPGL